MKDWGATGFHIWVNLIFIALIAGSWALRPPSRVLSSLGDGFSFGSEKSPRAGVASSV